jgi:hypothetical protein
MQAFLKALDAVTVEKCMIKVFKTGPREEDQTRDQDPTESTRRSERRGPLGPRTRYIVEDESDHGVCG